MRVRLIRWGGWLATLLCGAALLWVAGAIAIARVPTQRATIERLLSAETGLDVRYGGLRVRMGFYGPEAELQGVELFERGTARLLLRAPRLIARFESWRLLRGGQLRPGRVLIEDAEVDLAWSDTAAPDAAVAAAGSAAPSGAGRLGDLLQSPELTQFLARLPQGTLELESATLRLTRRSQRGVLRFALRAPRLIARRSFDGAQLSGTILLPAALGRSAFVSISSSAERAAGGAAGDVSTVLRVTARELVLAGWRELLGVAVAPVAGTGEVQLQARFSGSQLLRAELGTRLRDLVIAGGTAAPAVRVAMARGVLNIERRGDHYGVALQDLQLVPTGGGREPWFARRYALQLRTGVAGQLQLLTTERLPFLAARVALALAGSSNSAPQLGSYLADAQLRDLQIRWPGAPQPAVWSARLTDTVLEWPGLAAQLRGMQLQMHGSAQRASVEVPEQAITLVGARWGDAPRALRVALHAEWVDLGHGWSVEARGARLRLDDGAAVQGSFSVGGVEESPPAMRFAVTAELTDGLSLQQWSRASGASVPALKAGRIETGRVQLAGVVGSDGGAALLDYNVGTAVLRSLQGDAAAGWRSAAPVDADLRWSGARWQLQLRDATWGGARVRSASLGGLRDDPTIDFDAELEGDVGALAAALDAGRMGIAMDGLRGAATARVAGRWDRATSRVQRWRASAVLQSASWRVDPSWPSLEALSGQILVEDGELRAAALNGQWLGGPARVRVGLQAGAMRYAAEGRAAGSALERAWGARLSESAAASRVPWRAEFRALPLSPEQRRSRSPGRLPREWRLDLSLPERANAELRWLQDTATLWRFDGGTVQIGDGEAVARVPGALVVAGRMARLDLVALARVLARAPGGSGWQRPMVGQLRVAELTLGRLPLGEARLRLSGGGSGTTLALDGAQLAAEFTVAARRARHVDARFARLRLAENADYARLPVDLAVGTLSASVAVDELTLGPHRLGRLQAEFMLDEAGATLTRASLTRLNSVLSLSGECVARARRCALRPVLRSSAGEPPWAEALGLGGVRGAQSVDITAQLDWSTAEGAEWRQTLHGPVQAAVRQLIWSAEGSGASSGVAAALLGPTRVAWPGAAIEQLDFTLDLGDGVARIGDWRARGPGADLTLRGGFDLRQARVLQSGVLREGDDAGRSLPEGVLKNAWGLARRLWQRDDPARAPAWSFTIEGSAAAPESVQRAPCASGPGTATLPTCES